MNTYINISLFGYKLNKLQYHENLRSKLQSVSLKMMTSPMKIGIGKIFVNISPNQWEILDTNYLQQISKKYT